MSSKQIGTLVRYVGPQYPELAGMEGQIVGITQDFAHVEWKRGHANMRAGVALHELKSIRSYSKRFR